MREVGGWVEVWGEEVGAFEGFRVRERREITGGGIGIGVVVELRNISALMSTGAPEWQLTKNLFDIFGAVVTHTEI